MKTEYKVYLQNPIILDVTFDAHGQHVMWNGKDWLIYNSEEAIKFRNDRLIEFKERNNNLRLLENYHFNLGIDAAANVAEEWANGTASEIRKLKK